MFLLGCGFSVSVQLNTSSACLYNSCFECLLRSAFWSLCPPPTPNPHCLTLMPRSVWVTPAEWNGSWPIWISLVQPIHKEMSLTTSWWTTSSLTPGSIKMGRDILECCVIEGVQSSRLYWKEPTVFWVIFCHAVVSCGYVTVCLILALVGHGDRPNYGVIPHVPLKRAMTNAR